MRIVSWNIQFGIDVARAAAELAEFDELSNADIVLLQEMDRSGTELIAAAIGANHAFAAAAVFPRTGRDLGNAVLSKWPIGDALEIGLPHVARFGGQPRSALRATVDVDGLDVSVYSVHSETVALSLGRRVEQFGTITRDIAGFEVERPVIVGGDFNTVRRGEISALRRVMDAADLDPMTGTGHPTLRRFGRNFVLDHVFARGLTAVVSGVVGDAAASDHSPVWAEVAVPERSFQSGGINDCDS